MVITVEVAVHQHRPALRREYRVGPVAPGQHTVPLAGPGQHSKPGAECLRRGVRRRLRQRANSPGDRPQYPGIVQLSKNCGQIPRDPIPLGGPDPVPHLEERRRRHPAQDQHRRIAGNRCHLGQRQPRRSRPQRVQDLRLMADPQRGRAGPGELHHEPAVNDRAGRAVLRVVVWLKPSWHDRGLGQVRCHRAQRGSQRVHGRFAKPGQFHPGSMTDRTGQTSKICPFTEEDKREDQRLGAGAAVGATTANDLPSLRTRMDAGPAEGEGTNQAEWSRRRFGCLWT